MRAALDRQTAPRAAQSSRARARLVGSRTSASLLVQGIHHRIDLYLDFRQRDTRIDYPNASRFRAREIQIGFAHPLEEWRALGLEPVRGGIPCPHLRAFQPHLDGQVEEQRASRLEVAMDFRSELLDPLQ